MSSDRDTTTDSTDVQERLDRLESLVEQQQETIQQQRERIAELAGSDNDEETALLANRRNALKTGGLLALLFGSVGTASADSQGQVGTSNDPLQALYTANLHGDSGSVTANDTLDLSGNSLTDSSGDLTVEASSGNGVTLNTNGSSRALELGVPTDNGSNTAGGNVVAGHPNNAVNSSAVGVVIGGGGANNDRENTVGGNYATVGGGTNNTASGTGATVGGGDGNTVDGNYATVGGGIRNSASGTASVSGGDGNTASGGSATISGGANNTASGSSATVGGGEDNTASGTGATVPGGIRGAAVSDNTFVWNDGTQYHEIPNNDSRTGLSSDVALTEGGDEPTGANTFSVSATGGIRFITGQGNVTYIKEEAIGWSTNSSRMVKTNIDPVNPKAMLEGVTEMEVATWEYEGENGEGTGARHVGPMAEDFHDVVDVGTNDNHINSVNARGVAFGAIQGLAERLDNKDNCIDDQRERMDKLESRVEQKDDRIDAVEAKNEDLREENKKLRERVAAIETELGIDATTDRQGVADD
jgi:hypothetical protein